jgi:hypothetical protein
MIKAYMDSEQFVTVGKFLAPTEAQIAKGLLEAAGIECILQGENANNMLALAFRARLKVRQRDEEAAVALLEASEGQAYAGPYGGFDA